MHPFHENALLTERYCAKCNRNVAVKKASPQDRFECMESQHCNDPLHMQCPYAPVSASNLQK